MALGLEPMLDLPPSGAPLLLPKPVGEVTNTINLVEHCARHSEQFLVARRYQPVSIPRNRVAQMWKLSPQPQRPFSFGLLKVKPLVSAFVS